MLIGARFVQGVGGAMTSAVILGMIVTMFPEPREQAKAIGVYSFVASAGASIGLLAGGVLTEAINWHWIFFVNLPIGIGTAAARRSAARARPRHRPRPGRGRARRRARDRLADARASTRSSRPPRHGWGSAQTLGLGAVAVALLGAFVVREATARTPLMPLRIFRSRNVSGANVGADADGRGPVRHVLPRRAVPPAGARLRRARGGPRLPARGGADRGAVAEGRRRSSCMRFGARATLLPGLVMIVAGLALFARAPVDCQVRGRHPAGDGAARRRRRARRSRR